MNITKLAMARVIASGGSGKIVDPDHPEIKKLMKLKKTDLIRKYNLFLGAINENRD
ncbi:MAG TPA: hypothetical protein VMX17_01370 [Candidatus Glassbacteria bacterium]|nr:hypothetical protein [Candidatus Glassbacteria bacterium]